MLRASRSSGGAREPATSSGDRAGAIVTHLSACARQHPWVHAHRRIKGVAELGFHGCEAVWFRESAS